VNTNQTKTFLTTLFSNCEGLVEALAFDKDSGKRVLQIFSRDISEICDAVDKIKDTANCYFCTSTRKKESGNKEVTHEVVGLNVDIDFKDYVGGESEARKRLADFAIKPSIIINSGGGLHGYWLFYKPMLSDDKIEFYEGFNKGLAKKLGADNCWDISRRLRLPGTTNFPSEKKIAAGRVNTVACVIEEMNDLRYQPEDFKEFHEKVSQPIPKTNVDQLPYDSVKGKLEIDLASNDLLRHTWEGNRPDLKDNSRSGYDLSLANLLAIDGYVAEEIKAILQHNPSGKGKEATNSYLNLTVNKAMAANINKVDPKPEDENPLDQFIVPFEQVLLPNFIKNYLAAVGKTTASPDEFIVLASLAVFSAAIGTRSNIKVGSRSYWPAIWAMNVAKSSIQYKSTGNDLARPLLKWRENELEQAYVNETRQYKIEQAKYQAANKEGQDTKNEPQSPIRKEVIFADDETLESKYQTLYDSPQGGVSFYDEIAGFINGFDRYSGGQSVEVNKWLSIFDNGPIKYKRKKDKILLSVDRPFTSIIGATTIEGLSSFYNSANNGNGFLPRYIFNFCPPQTKNDDTFFKPEVDRQKLDELISKVKQVINMKDVEFNLSSEALALFEDWYREHNQLIRSDLIPEAMKAYWKRLEAYCLKFAHIFQIYDSMSWDRNKLVDVGRMKEAISLTNYLRGQVVKMVNHFRGANDPTDQDWQLTLKVARYVKDTPEFKIRDIQRAIHGSPPVQKIKEALKRLEKAGFFE